MVGELGKHGIVSSQDDPEGFAYYQLQAHMRALRSTGALLAVASKNSPEAGAVFDDNPDLALDADDFSSLQIHWEPKSKSIAQISRELGFGSEFMVFVDDNPFELAEVIGQHPYIDIIPADRDPLETLQRLADSRFFHTAQVTSADLSRHEHVAAKRAAAELQGRFDDYDDYLRAIDIEVAVAALGEGNRRRVLQLLQKSNQFNLTTRRHTSADVDALVERGATVGVFSYRDAFGSQGVIAAAILVPDGESLRIDSWVMSCRVLNRSVEQAACAWMIQRAGNRPVVGEYLPTERNGLVRDLFPRLGFRERADGLWEFDAGSGDEPPCHVARLV